MQRYLVPILGLLALVLLRFFCVRHHAEQIQSDLIEAGRQQLRQAGYDPEVLRVDGRDAILSGQAVSAEDRRRIVEVIGGVRGLRVVDDRLTIAAAPLATPSGSPGEPVRFAVVRSGAAVTLAGAVPTASHRDALLDRARDLWGSDNVSDELEVDASVGEPQWLAQLPDTLRAFERRTEAGTFDIDGGRVRLGGRVFAESARRALLARLEAALVGLELEDELEVRPPTSTVELQRTLDVAVLARTVEFETDKASLTPRGRAVLDEVHELLAGHPTVRIAISGHTDDRGEAAYNLDLSRLRAAAARDYLIGLGLARDRFESSGFGQTRPIADNATAAGRQRNRRIEFRVLEELR